MEKVATISAIDRDVLCRACSPVLGARVRKLLRFYVPEHGRACAPRKSMRARRGQRGRRARRHVPQMPTAKAARDSRESGCGRGGRGGRGGCARESSVSMRRSSVGLRARTERPDARNARCAHRPGRVTLRRSQPLITAFDHSFFPRALWLSSVCGSSAQCVRQRESESERAEKEQRQNREMGGKEGERRRGA